MTSSPSAGPSSEAGPGPRPRAGLRERKKARTRAAIRDAAMSLFEAQGYDATTIEQIAEAAEVSPSTFFRYFPTKEDVVLVDDWDPRLADAIRAQPPEMPPIDALLAGMRSMMGELTEADWRAERRRQRLFHEVPELRARLLQQVAVAVDLFAEVVAERAGKAEPDLESRAVAGAAIGVAMAIMPLTTGMVEPSDIGRFAEALDLLRKNLGGS